MLLQKTNEPFNDDSYITELKGISITSDVHKSKIISQIFNNIDSYPLCTMYKNTKLYKNQQGNWKTIHHTPIFLNTLLPFDSKNTKVFFHWLKNGCRVNRCSGKIHYIKGWIDTGSEKCPDFKGTGEVKK